LHDFSRLDNNKSHPFQGGTAVDMHMDKETQEGMRNLDQTEEIGEVVERASTANQAETDNPLTETSASACRELE
jgi:hypothetical protein